ncbi:carboxymuconolactone decarboxylase family protein [Corynebacterium diphtheriae]|uniref:carboxymuconolactone decarboxylase family protein n=1 Tax=Corynebacterium diphtheriae TaxID=1717 RepID=UPI000245A68C|nr:carboxymuconolactone decarboxylase family protein [Corynebacterium diphtheriae]AEX42111.1 alkyl hydroperoxide reductase subunit [Corynebacterium diphtheriae 31A]AEX48936.1 alkyl hydroperoxide reductase subunit [Corynebacterium diphtheriae BH8]MBG9356047.1 carboxymuconolactone decarboxylase family protein [Corynebacterium diphtheriae bv. mitis]MBN4650463.1 carboxymuconolactone decarboxylase family protein [Corynebacterium diphtheriae bv. mitis]MBN4652443.1 carboxymuconolactone decarboxylase 
MSLDNLKSGLPEYAKDLKLNLGSLARSTELTEQQLWGTFLAVAAATRNEAVFSEISEEASEHLSEEAINAALGAASIMAMNNVAYRAKGWLGDDYAQLKMGLRMNIIAKPGVDKVDFELWSLAVSTVNGCEHCTIAHEKTVRSEGLTKEQIFEAVKIAATLQGVAQAIEIEASR